MALDKPDVIWAPERPEDREAWRRELVAWREEARRELGYTGAAYRRSDMAWVSSCYSCNKLMLWDETFMNPLTGECDVDGYLKEGERVFGGYDAVVLWHAYPRIGFDDRNQFDYYREFPGGLEGVRDVVRRFHRHGVQIFVDYNPWDVGTRREPVSDATALAEVVRTIEADGIFLDTLNQGGIALREEIDRARKGVTFESELALPVEGIELNHASWAQWFDSGEAPGVMRNRWFEQRHMMHLVRRWDLDHSNELHLAWMNGAGMLVWENVFGSWNGWSGANQLLLRTMLPIQRHFHRHFIDGKWTPLVDTYVPGVYASEWDLDGVRLWTVVNRREQAAKGEWLKAFPMVGERLFDLVTGQEISKAEGEIGPRGIAAVLCVPMDRIDEDLRNFLAAQRSRHEDHAVYDRHFHPKPIPPIPMKVTSSFAGLSVPAGTYSVTSRFRARECGETGYARYQNLAYPPLHQEARETRSVALAAYTLAEHEVTNAEFAEFLRATGYAPKRKENFLRHWKDGRPVAGEENDPVVYVSLHDAQAYAKWRGLRLPTDAEWQVAMEKHRPTPGKRVVWNWTESVHTDGRTRFSILKGGSDYEAKGSQWYADGGRREPDFSAKFIHLWDGLDRCPTVGFRVLATS